MLMGVLLSLSKEGGRYKMQEKRKGKDREKKTNAHIFKPLFM